MNELDLARRVAKGDLPSPSPAGGPYLVAMRVSGTGLAFRPKFDEVAGRKAAVWLTPEMIARAGAGLPVIVEHPPGSKLDDAEFGDRAIGSTMLGYLADERGIQNDQGRELWAVARVMEKAARRLARGDCSTSPSVIFDTPKTTNTTIGSVVIEGEPELLDHLAICERGVWDKGGAPSGVRVDDPNCFTQQEASMADTDPNKTEGGDVTDRILAALEGLGERISKLEGGGSEAAADKARKDAKKGDDMTDPMTSAAGATEGAMADEQEGDPADPEYTSRLTEARSRADSVARAWSTEAPRPYTAESVNGYRRRALRNFQTHSKDFKSVDLRKVPAEMLDHVEKSIYADALAASSSPASAGPGRLREIRTPDGTGRIISTFVGDSSAWLDEFKGPKMLARVNPILANHGFLAREK